MIRTVLAALLAGLSILTVGAHGQRLVAAGAVSPRRRR